MSRYEIREQEPSETARRLGVTQSLFQVWDLQENKRAPFGNYPTRKRAEARIQRMEAPCESS